MPTPRRGLVATAEDWEMVQRALVRWTAAGVAGNDRGVLAELARG
jgi:hypothetical protein